jgi:hypothetical protein
MLINNFWLTAYYLVVGVFETHYTMLLVHCVGVAGSARHGYSADMSTSLKRVQTPLG